MKFATAQPEILEDDKCPEVIIEALLQPLTGDKFKLKSTIIMNDAQLQVVG